VPQPSRGEIWAVELDPTRGYEQGGRRPALVVSVDTFNRGPAGLVVVIPLSSQPEGAPLHVEVHPPEGGLKLRSFIRAEDVRSVSKERFGRRWGSVSPETMAAVEERICVLFGL
jgi:mRNA interferase MazF